MNKVVSLDDEIYAFIYRLTYSLDAIVLALHFHLNGLFIDLLSLVADFLLTETLVQLILNFFLRFKVKIESSTSTLLSQCILEVKSNSQGQPLSCKEERDDSCNPHCLCR